VKGIDIAELTRKNNRKCEQSKSSSALRCHMTVHISLS